MLREEFVREGGEHVWFDQSEAAPSWREIDRNLQRVAKRRAALDAEELRWLREAVREEVWLELGMVSLYEYLERRLGYGPRVAQDRVRVALSLDELPSLGEALECGELPFTAVRELTRVAIARTDRAWTDAARGKTVREIEELVAGRQRGDLPTDPDRPDMRLRTLRFEVRPETLAKLRDVQRVLEVEAGMALDDDALVATLCDAILAPTDRAKHQVMTTICPSCERGAHVGAGQRVAISRAGRELAECDAQRIDPDTKRAAQDVPPRTRRFVQQRDRGRCCVPGCRARRHLDLHHIVPRAAGGSHEPENLTLLCSGHHRALHDGHLTITGRAPALRLEWARDHSSEAILALTGLGYSRREAVEAVSSAHVGAAAPLEAWIRESLRCAYDGSRGRLAHGH
jgi:5-methylcytosine-specific restriction endonuclease McrA